MFGANYFTIITFEKILKTMLNKAIKLALIAILSTNFSYSQSSIFYNFTMKTIDGKDFNFSQLKGKKVLIVNTASEYVYTPQYEALEKLYKENKDKNFVILGFPANNFGKQEPGTNEQIQEFCTKNYGVSFPMFEKVSVSGEDMIPLYKWLTSKELNGVADSPVKWNFYKFLIDEKGNWVKGLSSKATPDSEEIKAFINQ